LAEGFVGVLGDAAGDVAPEELACGPRAEARAADGETHPSATDATMANHFIVVP
jgi:hypothetical protein